MRHAIDEKAAYAHSAFTRTENAVHCWRHAKGQDQPRDHGPRIFGDGFWLSGSCHMSPVAP